VGSGNGYFALPAARITDPAPVYALDVDEGLLADLDDIVAEQGIGNVETVRGDARSLTDHLPGVVDIVLIANTFHGVEATDTLVAEASDALAPGGQFVVVNWEDRPRETTTVAGEPRGPPTALRLSPEATERAVRDAAAFDLRRRVDLPPFHYALVFEV
jgi:ubiquinone/menaquinone biosynthesis C-methylase UbiE